MEGVRFPLSGCVYHRAEDVEAWRRSGAWLWRTLGDELRDAARESPGQISLIDDDGSLTFAELDARSESLAASLLDLGLEPGDRALFQFGSVAEIAVALFGCFKAGILPVCTLPQHRAIEIGQLAEQSGARAYFIQADYNTSFDLTAFASSMMDVHPGLEHLIVSRGPVPHGAHSLEGLADRYEIDAARRRTSQADPQPGDIAMLQLSGGSTGVPKIIPRFHAEYLGAAAGWNRRHRIGHDDVALWSLPLIHNAGMIVMLMPSLLARRTLIVQARFEPEAFLAAISRHRVTYTGSIGPIAPSIIERTDLDRFDLSSLRLIFTLARAEALEERTGVETVQMYGITEGLLMSSEPGNAVGARHRSLGWPTADDEICLLDMDGRPLAADDEVGELAFRGPHRLPGYFGAPELAATSFTLDGFFRTGDLVRRIQVNGRDHFVFEGRLKDNINRGGEKFSAGEVEQQIAAHPAISDVSVVAMPDPMLGERACAFVIPRPGTKPPTVSELSAFLSARGLAKFKSPERIETLSEFPVTRVGKVDKAALRQLVSRTLARESGEPDL